MPFEPVAGQWARKEKDGTAEQPRLVYIQAVLRSGKVRYIAANSYCGRAPRDERAGWTKPRTCEGTELSTLLMSWDQEKIAAYVAEIGQPEGTAS